MKTFGKILIIILFWPVLWAATTEKPGLLLLGLLIISITAAVLIPMVGIIGMLISLIAVLAIIEVLTYLSS